MAELPLSPGGFCLAVLDACALLPPRLSNVLLDLALEGLYLPHWTAEIEDEFLRNFHAVTGAATAGGATRRLAAFRAAARMRHEIFGHMDPGAIAKAPAALDKTTAISFHLPTRPTRRVSQSAAQAGKRCAAIGLPMK